MTRDEAIGRIKARFDKWALDDEDMKAIQTLIPELSESEDERIRKEIVGVIQKHYPNTPESYRWIAWLEKQKEQNGEDEECTDFTIYYPLKNEKGEYECIPYSFYDSLTFFSEDKDLIDFHRACFYTEEECNEWIERQKEQKPVDYDHEMWKNCEANFEGGKKEVIDHPEKYGLQKPAEWSEDTIRKAVKEVGLTQHQIDWFKNNVFPPKPEWSEEDEKKLERVDDLLWMLDDYLGNDCSICEEKTARLRDEIHNELFPWLEFLRPQYHGDVTMTEAYKMGLEAGKASSWKPSEEQTNNVIVELTRIELGDIINGLYYLKEKYYEDCKEHNGTATMGLSDEFKFYFKRFNEVLDLYARLHELEKERYGTTTDGYYYE